MDTTIICLADDDEDSTDDCIYCPLNTCSFVFDRDRKVITGIYDTGGNLNEYILSTSMHTIYIESLGCSSYDEFLVALDLHDLVHSASNVPVSSTLRDKDSKALIAQVKALEAENAKLKKTMSKMKALLNGQKA